MGRLTKGQSENGTAKIESRANSVGFPVDARDEQGAFGRDDRDQSEFAKHFKKILSSCVRWISPSVHAHRHTIKRRLTTCKRPPESQLLHPAHPGNLGRLRSTSLSRAATNPDCSSSRDFRPPPGRRWRSAGSGLRSLSSLIPLRIVRSEIPVATAIAAIPPLPREIASLAAQRRRPRSSKS
jgi:hypothetical protein